MGRFALIALLSGCHVKQADCRTECGMHVFGVAPEECDRLNPVEEVAVAKFSYLYPQLCDRMSSASLRVYHVDGGWVHQGQRVAGLTWCDLELVEVAGTDWRSNAYMHEMAHVAQCPFQDYAHATWADAGIWAAIQP